MAKRRRVRRVALLISGLALSLGTSACGGDSGGGGDSELRVIQSVPDSVTEVGVQAGQHLGTYEECLPDLEVERTVGTAVEQAIAADSADIGIIASNSVVAAIASGLEATIIGSSMDGWNQALIMEPTAAATSIEELEPPLKLGITRFGSAGHYASLRMAEDLGWSEDDIEFVTVGKIDSLRAGLGSGLFDGFVWGPDTGEAMEAAGEGKVIGNLAELIGPNVQIFYVVSNELLEDRPEDVKAFMDCTFQAVRELKADRQTAIEFFVESAKKDPVVSEGLVDRDLAFASSDGAVSPEAMEGVLDAVHRTVPEQEDLTIEQLQDMYTYWNDL